MNAQTEKARVLFVDDEPRVLNTMRMLFRGQYEIFSAESGQKALELLKTQPVDVIVSDQRMPGMTGIELLRAARELNPNAMRILLTGYSDLNAIIGSINDGEIFRFISKPWSDDDLTATVARAAAAAQATRGASASASDEPESASTDGHSPGVLVLDDDPGISQKIRTLLPGLPVHGATSMDDAITKLENEHIGVVISDTRVKDHPVLNLISALKEHHPELVSVILTDRADADAAIGLINQGQIYRFITKPIQDGQCKITVNSALKQHNKLAKSPELKQRYQVDNNTGDSPDAKRVKSLRTLVKRWV